MNDFQKEKEIYSQRYNEELKKTGIFFAFSDTQFEENKIPKNANPEEFLSCGNGSYIHKGNKKKLDDFFNITEKELKKDFLSKVTIESMIDYELINHECYYTEQPLSIVDLIQDYYKEKSREEIIELIQSVYKSKQKEEQF